MGINFANARGRNAKRTYLTVFPVTTVATALINQSSFDHTLAELTVDNTSAGWSNVRAGMSVWIGSEAGTHDVGIFRVRKTPTSTTLYLNEHSQGDFGLMAHAVLEKWANNKYVTVVDDYNLWGTFSRIVISGDTGTFYKDYDTAYTNQNSTTPPCPVNMGGHVAGFVNGSNVLSVSKTITIDPFLGETISSISTDIGSGSFTSGSSSTASFTATFPAGPHTIRTTVTLSSGRVLYAERMVYAHNTTTYAPIAVQSISNDRRDQIGRQMSLTLMEDIDLDQYAKMVIVWEDAAWNSTTYSEAITQFVGWVTEWNTTLRAGQKTRDITVQSALLVHRNIPVHSQQIVEKTSPSNWQEAVQALCHATFVTFYLLYYHTRLTELFDCDFEDLSDYTFQAWAVNYGNIVSHAQDILDRLEGWLGQGSDGTLYVARIYSLQDADYRAVHPALGTLTAEDILEIQLPRTIRPTIYRVEASAFAYDGIYHTAYALLSHAPGSVGGQGSQVFSADNKLVEGQSQLNRRAANHWARENNPFQRITVKLRNYDFFEPARGDMIEINPANVKGYSNEFPENEDFTIEIIEVAKEHRGGMGYVTVVGRLVTDALNAPGLTIPIPDSDNPPDYDPDTGGFGNPWDDYWNPGTVPLPQPPEPPVVDPIYTLAAWNADGIGFSENTLVPDFVELVTHGTNKVIQYVLFSPFAPYLGSYTGALAVYILQYNTVDNETDWYYEDDMLGETPSFPIMSTLDGKYDFLRASRAVDGTIIAFGRRPGTGSSTYTDGFTSGYGEKIGPAGVDGLPSTPVGETEGAIGGYWTPSGGRTDAGCVHSEDTGLHNGYGYSIYGVFLCIDLGAECKISSTSFWWKHSATTITIRHLLYIREDGTTYITKHSLANTLTGNTWYRDATGASEVPTRYIVLEVWSAQPDPITRTIWVDDISITHENLPEASVAYSDDYGDTNVVVDLNNSDATIVGDIDDYGDETIGVILAAASNYLECAYGYGEAFAEVSGADVTPANHGCIRIPYRRFTDNEPNSDPEDLEFVFGADAWIADDTTLWIASIDATATPPTVLWGLDRTPVIEGTTYRVIAGANTIETYAGNPNYMRAIVRDADDDEGAVKLIRTTDGGQTWYIECEGDYQFVHHVSSTSAWVVGTDGIDFVNGSTVDERDGDFESAVGTFPALGVQKL